MSKLELAVKIAEVHLDGLYGPDFNEKHWYVKDLMKMTLDGLHLLWRICKG